MKIKTISRPNDYSRETNLDIFRVQKNLDPSLHPFEKAREYTRALNATKLSRLFAKPFLSSMAGHIDGVYTMAKHPHQLTTLASGAGDGEIRLWSLGNQKCTWSSTQAHKGFVKGLCFVPFEDSQLLSVGDDKTIKLWDASKSDPILTRVTKNAFTAIDHHRSERLFATASSKIDIWNYDRSEPVYSYTWGAETITSVKMNQTEKSILASCGTDRSITLYDLRTNSPISKVIMDMRTNAIAWNPMEAFNFSVANEDHNIYTFDMRNMARAINVGKDHVAAVLDIDYSPTGQEIVTGSYDRTIRIFGTRDGRSREVYHTNRMQKIFCVKFSMDSKFVLSGSDDGNIRLWKAVASDKLGHLTVREKNSRQYANALKERYKHMPEIHRIDKQRKVPTAISSAGKKKRTMLQSVVRKEENERKHSAPGTKPYKAERNKHVVTVEK